MRSQLQKALDLAARTGDKIIVVDELNDRSLVVMNTEDYEKLLNGQNKGKRNVANLTEEELLDKINRDIVSWKDNRGESDFEDDFDDEEDFDDFNEDDDDDESPFIPRYGTAEDEDLDWAPPRFDADMSAEAEEEAEGNIIAEPEDEVEEKPSFAKATEDESSSAKATEGEEENLYYYNEPSSAEATEGEAGNKADSGFVSIKDELKKNHHGWEIPTEAKDKAEKIEEIPF